MVAVFQIAVSKAGSTATIAFTGPRRDAMRRYFASSTCPVAGWRDFASSEAYRAELDDAVPISHEHVLR